MTTCLPLSSIFPVVLWMKLYPAYGFDQNELIQARPVVGAILLCVFLGPYVLARLFLMVEIFRSLLFLPPEAFIDTWSGSFPHWG